MCHCEKRIVQLREKLSLLQDSWAEQQQHLDRVQLQVQHLRSQLQVQGQFCVSVGTVLTELLWKATKSQEVVDVMVQSPHADQFLDIADNTLEAFLEAYADSEPAQSAEECRFVAALLGTLANVAAADAGRRFLSAGRDPRGLAVLRRLVHALPRLPAGAVGAALRRLIFMALYNLAIGVDGLHLIHKECRQELLPSLQVSESWSPEARELGLRLLQALTFEMANHHVLADFLRAVPLQFLAEQAAGPDNQFKLLAQQVLDNLERATIRFRGGIPGGRCRKLVPYDRCLFVKEGERLLSNPVDEPWPCQPKKCSRR
ncbi:uncharacterized protein LOC126281588 [Schistocerca gregaria]|uniref:uncharacterized protein LOC126281588 n=1 Tax=Schistocerca gregaria TaxID=7010 RepID=UPI00211ED90D|nr:uncharacterized protein LOC126281588 [Schistocerca gregaria]